MQFVLLIVLVCAAADILVCGLLLAVVWLEHRRLRSAAARLGESLPSANGQFGCLIALGLIGLGAVYGAIWLLLEQDVWD